MAKRHLVLIGAVCIDRTYHVPRPARLGEAMRCLDFTENWGGKVLNQAVALACAGESPIFHAKVGDRDRDSLFQFLESRRINGGYIRPAAGATNHGIIQMTDDGSTAIVGFASPAMCFSRTELDAILETLVPGDVLLLQNEVDNVPYLLAQAKARGCGTVLNPSPWDPQISGWPLESVDLLILNEDEGRAITGRDGADDILHILQSRWPETATALTLGSRGSIFQVHGQRILQPAYPATPVDTLGAGDTFAGYLLASLVHGFSISNALDLAARASAITVGRRGAAEAIPQREEVII